MKVLQFGEVIPGLEKNGRPIDIPVLNERTNRAAAGLMLAAAVVAFANAALVGELLYLRILVGVFTLEFLLRVLVNPNFAPFYALGKLIVRGQEPEYTGAPQKRFAWALGLMMAVSMSVIVYGFSITGALPFVICSTCIGLLWFESAFGICIGCKMYGQLYTLGILENPPEACPGNVCEIPAPRGNQSQEPGV